MNESHENAQNYSSSALLAEMMEKDCPAPRQEKLLFLLRESSEKSEESLWEYARGLAYRTNRLSDWDLRLERLEILRGIALRERAPEDLRLLYAQAVFHRMNAELDMREMFQAGESLVELSRSEKATPQIDEFCARAIMNRLRISPNLTMKWDDVRFLRELAGREGALPQTRIAAAKGCAFLFKVEHDLEKKEEILEYLEEIFQASAKSPETIVVYAQALEYAIRTPFSSEKLLKIMDSLQELERSLRDAPGAFPSEGDSAGAAGADSAESVEKARRVYAETCAVVRESLSKAFAYLVEFEKNPVQQCVFLAALKTEILQNRSLACFREAYARGIAAALLRQNSQRQQYLLEEARKLAEAEDSTMEIRVQYAATMLCRLLCADDAGEIADLLTRIAGYYSTYPASPDFHCLYASAILLTMRWEPAPEKRKLRVQLLENWRSVYRTRFADLFRMCRNEYLEHEADAEVRQTILDSIR